MPWQPSKWDAVPDHRFDPYRERAGRLFDEDGGEAGFVFVRMDWAARQLGGALWWRRWSEPFEQVEEYYMLTGGMLTDTVTAADDLGDEVLDWGLGRLSLGDETYRVDWLDAAESMRIRDDVFGLDAPDDRA